MADDVVQDLQAAADADKGDTTTPAPADQQDFGENFEKLPDDRIEELRQICQKLNLRNQWARMVEVIRCTLRRYFWLGIQHGFWNADTQQLQIGPNGGAIEDLNEEDLFAGDFNIYTQNGKIFIAVFSQNAASSRMEPDDANSGDSIAAAEEAEKYVKIYLKYNPPQMAQQEVAQLLWTDGRVLAVTETDEDEDLGTEDDEEGNPVPRMTELTRYFGVLESQVPFLEPFSKWPGCKVSRDMDILTAKDENPKFANDLKTSAKGLTPNDEIARMSRIATGENIAQVSSDTLAYLVTEDRWWLRRSAFQDLADDRRAFWIGGESKAEDGTVTKTKGIFPQGCRTKFIGSVYCGAKAVNMNRQVRVMHAMPGKGNARPSLSDAMIPIQMEFNDAVGMYSEMIHKCIPRIWVNAGPDEIAAILEQISRYGEYSPFTKPDGLPLEQNFFPEPTIEVPASFPAWVENLQGPLSQFVTGNQPALFGEAAPDQKTAAGYAQMRDMSLGLMALVWVPYMEFASSIRGQAALCAKNREGDSITAVVSDQKNKAQTVSVDLGKMRDGGFICRPKTDQNFPQSWTQESNTWKQLLAAAPTNPVLAMDLQLPNNKRKIVEALAIDIEIQGADSSALQLSEWSEMRGNGGPVPDDEATAQRDQQRQQMAQQAAAELGAGAQLPPLPKLPPILVSSVPIDSDTDDHVTHALEMFYILNSPEGQQVKKEQPEVWQDGKIHMLAHVAVAKAKGLVIPPPLGGAPAMPMIPPGAHPGPGAPGAGAPPLALPTGATNNVSTTPPAL
jgi:hypothetical protein